MAPATTTNPRSTDDYQASPVDDTIAALDSDRRTGISTAGAKGRLERFGPNEIEEHEEPTWHQIFRRFWGPIPWMIEIAAVLSAAVRRWEDFTIIMVMLLVNAGIDFFQEHRALNAVKALQSALATQTTVLRDGTWSDVPSRDLVPGDVVRLKIGDIIPADVQLIDGAYLLVDQSSLTGESLPVSKKPGDVAYSKTIVKQGEMTAIVLNTGPNTNFHSMVSLVVQAEKEERSHFQQMVIRIGDFLIAITVVLVLIIIAVGIARGQDVVELIRYALVLTVAAIPVALPAVLSVTMAVGAVNLAKQQAIVSRLVAIEELAGIDILCSDKTGTLTRGAMTLTDVITDEDEQLFLTLAGSVEAASEHPIGKAVALGAEERDATLSIPDDFEALRGQGVVGTVDGFEVTVGKPKLMAERGLQVPDRYTDAMELIEIAGNTAFLVGWDGVVRGTIGVADTVRSSSAEAVSTLKGLGVEVVMLTGDNRRTAETIAAQIGITTVIAEVLPGDKAEEIRRLQHEGRSVGFVGDGINDAPALTQADLGMAVGSGTDVAIEAGDVVLMSGDPMLAVTSLRLARKTFSTIKQNLYWAFGYNTAAIPLAALGFLNPMIAAGAMAFSSVSVVTNSVRLRRFGK
jgi:H+-transporting ATPase